LLIALPLLLAATFAWQVGSGLVHTDVAVRQPVAVGRSSLEADPAGTRLDLVVVDRVGQDTTVDGTILIRVREPDGAVWQTSRTTTADDFQRLPQTSLLGGRTGYSVVIPAVDWARQPRHGGATTVSISVQPTDGSSFSTVDEEQFP
jgi:hypothetical protein